MYDTILIPTDGSEHAVRAAEHGRYLAEKFGATVHVVSVVDVQAAAGVFDAGGVDDEYTARLEADGTESIEAVEAALEGADVRTELLRGRPDEAILDYVDDHDVDVVAMGTHGRTGINRYIAGSVTERVVRLSDVPVLTVRATDRSRVVGDYEEVLVPTDGSEAAEAAVDHAVAVAERAGARVHVLDVLDVANLTTPEYSLPPDVVDQLEADCAEATERVAARAREAGLETVTEVREGYPGRTILDYADENDVDLIAMGTAGRTGMNRYLLGSTTERVVRRSEVPVLAVNARERESE